MFRDEKKFKVLRHKIYLSFYGDSIEHHDDFRIANLARKNSKARYVLFDSADVGALRIVEETKSYVITENGERFNKDI